MTAATLVIFAAEIPDGIVYALTPVVFVLLASLMAWMVRELGRTSETNGRLEERMQDAEERLRDHSQRLRDLERIR